LIDRSQTWKSSTILVQSDIENTQGINLATSLILGHNRMVDPCSANFLPMARALRLGGNMKTVVTTIALGAVLALVPAGLAQAVTCGIGNRIWDSRGDGIGKKLLASTTNVWTLKAISTTFGVAGCDQWEMLGLNAPNEKVLHFASRNLDRLARDMARGSGEHLDVLATLMRVGDEDRVAFQSLSRENFAVIFSRDDVTVGEVLYTLHRLLAEDEKLSVYVTS